MDRKKRFVHQSYENNILNYESYVNDSSYPVWDCVVITASNERQAEIYRAQIEHRLAAGRLCARSRYLVIPDIDGRRIGSGGSTLNVLRALVEAEGLEKVLSMRMLLIHSGGDSKRIPQYSTCGKLFAPVPRMLCPDTVSSIFDELLTAFSGLPARVPRGIMVLPGDTALVFNPLQLNVSQADAVALSMKAPVAEGVDHGVFVSGGGVVSRFLHKQPESVLRANGAVNGNNLVDIDTGAIWLSTRVVERLFSLISSDGMVDEALFEKFVNPQVCLNFYTDFVYPLAGDSTREEYLGELPETSFSKALEACREAIWNSLSSLSLQMVSFAPARYIHFGSTRETYDLMTSVDDDSLPGWRRQLLSNRDDDDAQGSIICSYVDRSVSVPYESFIESSIVEGKGTSIGRRTILSHVHVQGQTIPDGVVLHTLKLQNGRFVCRIYGIADNPKESANGQFLGSSLEEMTRRYSIDRAMIWDQRPASIWNARIYQACDDEVEAVGKALLLYRIACGQADKNEVAGWLESERYSLDSSFNSSSVHDLLDWEDGLRRTTACERLIQLLSDDRPMAESLDMVSGDGLSLEYLSSRTSELPFPVNMRVNLALSELDSSSSQLFEDRAYEVLKDAILASSGDAIPALYSCPMVTDEVVRNLPVRINFCGSPSDAAPYCIEHGGAMLDGTILLKGRMPIQARVTRIEEPVIRLSSSDLHASLDVRDIGQIRACGDPHDTFALHKAVLVASGLVPMDGDWTLDKILHDIGGGLELSTSVDVPKGSGLGTSSIVAAACLQAIFDIFGHEYDEDDIYTLVFIVEQLMGTGGGWQDQVGGLTPGFKFFTSRPGLRQKIDVRYMDIPEDTLQELQSRFVLVFSGQQRLARGVLRGEMNQCIRNDRESLDAIADIKDICALMRYRLESGDVTGFAHLLSRQFSLVRRLDEGASNPCLDYIFDVCDDLIDGKSICGAGGGGFLMMILKQGLSRAELEERIGQELEDTGVAVWDSQFI